MSYCLHGGNLSNQISPQEKRINYLFSTSIEWYIDINENFWYFWYFWYFQGIGGILGTFFLGTLGILGFMRVIGSTFFGGICGYNRIFGGGCLMVVWSILEYLGVFFWGILFPQKGGEQKDDNC